MVKNTKLCGQPILCQIVKLIPNEIFPSAVIENNSDYYYKSMTTYKQFVFMLYGVITKCDSLNSVCKNLLFLEDKLTYLGITELPATSTLSDANINRASIVFATVYLKLYTHYKTQLSATNTFDLFEDKPQLAKQEIFILDSSSVSLFTELVRGAGRTPISGKKKGGQKVHSQLPLGSQAPDLVYLTEAAMNDKTFLGQLNPKKGAIYIFDKGYVNYKKWQEWTDLGVYYVTRLNENANYKVISGQVNDPIDYADGGVISDQIIQLTTSKTEHKARLIIFKDLETGKILKFVSNMFEYAASTIIQLYKYRWSIEVFFKRLKQNFQLDYFFSDSIEGIKTQIWVALIANLLLTVLHKLTKEVEIFRTMVAIIANNMTSYLSIVKMLTAKRLTPDDRNLKIIQLNLFKIRKGGVFENSNNSP